MAVLRLIVDPPAEGAWNMAVDEALLESAPPDQITLRFYQWSPATLSLGYFQAYDEREGHVASLPCPIVRRATGGGAILHDRELTYSLVVPVGGRFSAEATRWYDLMHETLVAALSKRGVAASLHQGVKSINAPAPAEPFLCFERRASGDVVYKNYKIAGSAQRRHHGTVLQHGSVLLSQSPHAPELPGVAELSDQELEADKLQSLWLSEIESRLELQSTAGKLTKPEADLAVKIRSGKFAADEWTRRR